MDVLPQIWLSLTEKGTKYLAFFINFRNVDVSPDRTVETSFRHYITSFPEGAKELQQTNE